MYVLQGGSGLQWEGK